MAPRDAEADREREAEHERHNGGGGASSELPPAGRGATGIDASPVIASTPCCSAPVVVGPAAGATKILPYLYLGGSDAACDADFLARSNVKLVVNLSQEGYWLSDPSIFVSKIDVADRADADILAVCRKVLPMLAKARDRWAAAVTEPRALTAITTPAESAAGGCSPVLPNAADAAVPPPTALLHCQKGVSRSATVAIAFLMHQNGWTVQEALEFVQRRRPQVSPNLGFMDQLETLYGLMSRKAETSYNRPALREQLCLLLRNVSNASPDHLRNAFEPFGDVAHVEWFDEKRLCAVFFSCRQGRQWAERAIQASAALRVLLSGGGSSTPASIVRIPSSKAKKVASDAAQNAEA